MKFLNGSIYSINAAALLIGAAGLLSRILGVLRDRMLASQFGASRELDIYYAAFQIPDFVFMIFLLGAASAAIIPVFVGIKNRSFHDSRVFIEELWGSFLIVSVVVGVLAIFFTSVAVPFIAPGFSDEEQDLVTALTRIMMISPIFLGLSGVISSVIQSARRFFAFAFAPIAYNLGIIFGIVVFLPKWGLAGLALGVVLGAMLHLLVQIPSFFSLGYRISFCIPRGISAQIKQVMKLSLPRMIASSLRQFTIIVLVALASTLAAGSIAVFQFAYHLHFLPIGIFGVSFAVAAFPSMSEYGIRREGAAFMRTYYATIRSILFWILPFAVFFYVLRAQIVRVALGAGRFDWEDTILTAAVLGLMSVAIIAESVIPFVIRSYYALGKTRKPLVINAIAFLATILASVWFVAFLQEGQPGLSARFAELLRVEAVENIAVLGLALALSLGGAVNLFLLMRGFPGEVLKYFGVNENSARESWIDIIKIGIVSLLAGLVSFGTLRFVNFFITLDTFWGVFFQGFISFVVGMGFYGALLYMLGNREVIQLIETVRRRLIRTEFLPTVFDGSIK